MPCTGVVNSPISRAVSASTRPACLASRYLRIELEPRHYYSAKTDCISINLRLPSLRLTVLAVDSDVYKMLRDFY